MEIIKKELLLKNQRKREMKKANESEVLEYAQKQSKAKKTTFAVVKSGNFYHIENTTLPFVRSGEKLVGMFKNGVKCV